MRPRRRRALLGWDHLEARDCPAALVAAPTPPALMPSEVPAERQEANAQALAASYAQEAAWSRPNVLFLGDSITYYFGYGAGAPVWQKQIAPLNAADFGVPGDMTQNILWRIEHGELAGDPPVIVLLAGTNNLVEGRESVVETSAGIGAIVAAIRATSPGSKILLTGVFPCFEPDGPLRQEVQEVNDSIRMLADGVHVFFMNPGASMVAADGSIANDFEPDLGHPNAAGYELWAEQLVGPIEHLLGHDAPPAATTTLPVGEPRPLAATTSGRLAPPWT